MICTTTAAAVTVVGGKTESGCNSCICRRARWHCTADDTFLRQNCDSSVHSANPRLQTSSISKHGKLAPTWHDGFKRKARTPRPTKARTGGTVTSLVPEIETSPEDGSTAEEQLSYRVPTFDPVIADFCDSNSAVKPKVQSTDISTDISNSSTVTSGSEFLASFLQSDAELAEFTVDMESLLGRALDNDSFMEELGLMGNYKYDTGSTEESEQVKEELDNAEEDVKPYEEIDPSRQTLETNFDCRSADEEQEEATETAAEATEDAEGRKKIGLRLNYEAIVVEWSVSGSLSPWMNGEQPQFGPDDCWLDHMGMWGGAEAQGLVLQGEMGTTSHLGEGREARVSRYREKRRTRLFSKRIRYEVRKLNAEKRPRMKGRFVKRAAFTAAASGAAARALSTD